MSKFGTELTHAMARLNITENQLAKEIDKSQGWINRIKNAKTPPTQATLTAICAAIEKHSHYHALRILIGALKDQCTATGYDTQHILIKPNKKNPKT